MLRGTETRLTDSVTATGSAQPALARNGSPDFSAAVPRDGYRWWYLDAFSDDGRCGLTLIAFIGSVFSPYYAAARRRGPSAAEQFCSMNAILYGPRRHRWAMTERGSRALRRDTDTLHIGPSSLAWDGSNLAATIDEVTVPIPGRLRGRIRIALPFTTQQCYPLDCAGQHRWWPVAPAVRVEVTMDSPDLAWEGTGYFDCNAGTVPLESTFRGWHWCRGTHADGGSTVLYSTEPRAGESTRLALRFDSGGTVSSVPAPREVELPSTPVWRVHRRAGCDPGDPARVYETLEDTPFYGRSKMGLNLGGERVICMHESLDLDRFDRRWVQTLLPFRMPRRG